MWVWRALVNDFVEIEESSIGDSFFAEGLQTAAAVVGEEPCCAERDGTWGGGDFGGRVLLQSCG